MNNKFPEVTVFLSNIATHAMELPGLLGPGFLLTIGGKWPVIFIQEGKTFL